MNSGSDFKILVINPGSTSTGVALFEGDSCRASGSLPASLEGSQGDLWDEFPPRLESVRAWMKEEGIKPASLDAVVGRGGLFRPVEGGTYRVTEAMLADALGNRQGVHASNLGCALAQAVADEAHRTKRQLREWDPEGPGVPAFVVDPVSTDEFGELARFSGIREIQRTSLSHALSIHALVYEVCRVEGRPLKGSRFVVAHLGGGISVCPVRDGRILDANNANSGGPFSPTRAGGLPTQELLKLALSGRFSEAELRVMTVKRGGLSSYLGTDDAREVESRIARGDEEALVVYEAMAYQIAKEIGAMVTVLSGRVDKILLTGGLAASSMLTRWITDRVGSLAPMEIWPEVEEMKALAQGALRALTGEQPPKEY